MHASIVAFVLGTLAFAVCLWLGMKVAGVIGSPVGVLAIAAISALLRLLPYVGPLVSLIAMLGLLCKWTDADLLPEAALIVIAAQGIYFVAAVFFAGMFR